MKHTKANNSFSELPFSLERKQIVDFLLIAKEKHTATVIIELDISGIRQKIRAAKRKFKRPASLTAYLIYSFGQAVAENKEMQAYRKGNKLVVFEDVDIATMIERTQDGTRIPVSYVIRKANEKSMFEIAEELLNAKATNSDDLMDCDQMRRKKKLINVIKRVGFLRRWFLRRIFKNAFMKKEFNGTVGFSSMGMFSYNVGGWIVPISPQVLSLMVGGIRELAGFDGDKVVKKELIDLSISIDHDVLDGAQTARFVEVLRKSISKGVNSFFIEEEQVRQFAEEAYA